MSNLNITLEYVHHFSYILTWGYPTGVWEDGSSDLTLLINSHYFVILCIYMPTVHSGPCLCPVISSCLFEVGELEVVEGLDQRLEVVVEELEGRNWRAGAKRG